MKRRYFELDLLRGLAVVLMVFFHFGYDLALFGYADYETTVDTEWVIFRGVIVTMFLLAVGMSVHLAYFERIIRQKLWMRTLKLFIVSLLISAGSYFIFPHQWIYFGVIHFIMLATIVSLLFLHIPTIALFVGVFIILSYVLGYFRLDPLLVYGIEHFYLPEHTVDVVSFTPWFGVVLIGMFLMHNNLFGLQIKERSVGKKVSFLGQHSLLIYLLHQPILFGVFNMIKLMR